jgi:hypothetical protein
MERSWEMHQPWLHYFQLEPCYLVSVLPYLMLGHSSGLTQRNVWPHSWEVTINPAVSEAGAKKACEAEVARCASKIVVHQVDNENKNKVEFPEGTKGCLVCDN